MAKLKSKYPQVSSWILDGSVEIGQCDWTDSFIRVLDEGGLVWEGHGPYNSIEDALADAEQAIMRWNESEPHT